MKVDHLDAVLENCKHYDDIVGYTVLENDEITKDMIRYYQDYVFFNWNQSEKIKEIDKILNEYLKNIHFYKYIQMHFNEVGDFLPIYDILLSLYNRYQDEAMKKINNTKWI